MEALQKLYKSFIKKLYVYKLLKEHVDFLTTLCIFSSNLCVTKVDNNPEINSVRSSLDLGNKIWIGKPFIDTVFHFKNPNLDFSFLPPVSFEII